MRPIDLMTQVLEVIAALAAAPLFVGWVNQCRAWLQNRSAPSLWLPYRSIRKLFHKEAVIADTASPLFRTGFRWNTLLFPMQDLVSAFQSGMIHTYYDIIQLPN